MCAAAALAVAALLLGGCATVPLATGLAIAGLGVSGAALTATLVHNCRADGGCKQIPLPR